MITNMQGAKKLRKGPSEVRGWGNFNTSKAKPYRQARGESGKKSTDKRKKVQ